MAHLRSYFKYLRFWHYPKKVWIPVMIAIIALSYYGYSQTKPKVEIQTTAVKRQAIQETISASSILTGRKTANLHFLSGGKLANISVKEGDRIEEGTTVASLDMQQLSINLTQAQNNVRSTQAAVDKAIDDIHLNQYGNGGFDKVGSAEETQAQKNSRTTAEVQRDNAVDTLKAAQRAFQDAVLIAPISGIVTLTVPVQGQNVTGADTIAQIVDDSEIYIDAEVDESDIGKISVGQKANITLNSYPDQTFSGTISQIIPNTKTTTSGATVVVTRIKLDNQNINFIANINGQANIIIKEAQNSIVIPQDALVEGNAVYVKDGENYKKVDVKTGISSDIDVEVVEGLTEGQEVVTNPSAVQNKK